MAADGRPPAAPGTDDLPIGLSAASWCWTPPTMTQLPGADRRRGHAQRGWHPRRVRYRADRAERLDRQRRSGPPGRSFPRPAQHGGPRAARCLPGHPDGRPPWHGTCAGGGQPLGHGRGWLLRRSSRIHQRCDGQPGGVGTGPRRWARALQEADLPDDTPTGVEAEGRQILLYRHHGRLYAIDNICSHAGGLLSRSPVGRPDRDLPAARVTFFARHRLRQPRPGQPAATCATYPDPSWLDRGARQPAGTPASRRVEGHRHDVRSRRESRRPGSRRHHAR